LSKRVIVAIDGPAGSGKSTLARRIAERLGYLYIDTGAMYRAVALWALRNGTSLEDHHRLETLAESATIHLFSDHAVFLNGEDVTEAIRAPEISQAASRVSAIAGVRRAMVRKQREMAELTSVVMEGRDIGSVVFPDAEVKIFLDADVEVRGGRRLAELAAKGVETTRDQVLQEMRERDQRDRSRAEAPLMQAPDAMYVDTSGLTIEQVEEELLRVVRARTSNGKEVAH
jgi:cytidylate kinase